MEITEEAIKEEFKRFDGTCPFSSTAVECGGNCMTVKECNDCSESKDYRDDPVKYFEGERQGEYFKVNLPTDYAGYQSGSGEGCFAKGLTLADTEKANDDNSYKQLIQVVLCNDSIYLPPLRDGAILQVETRGNRRPVLDVKWLNETLKRVIDEPIYDIPL